MKAKPLPILSSIPLRDLHRGSVANANSAKMTLWPNLRMNVSVLTNAQTAKPSAQNLSLKQNTF